MSTHNIAEIEDVEFTKDGIEVLAGANDWGNIYVEIPYSILASALSEKLSETI